MKKVFSLIIAIACISGCKDPVSSDTGVISGTVILHNENGDSLKSDGVLISVVGLNTTVLTEASGHWSLSVPTGKHSIGFTKTGYGAMKVFDIETKINDTVGAGIVHMTVPSREALNLQMLRVTLGADSIPWYFVQGKMEQTLAYRAVVLCISKDSAALANDPNSAPAIYPFLAQGNFYDGQFTWSSTSATYVVHTPFAHGEQVFATLAISGAGQFSEPFSNYFDPTLSKRIFTALGPVSQIVKVIIP